VTGKNEKKTQIFVDIIRKKRFDAQIKNHYYFQKPFRLSSNYAQRSPVQTTVSGLEQLPVGSLFL